MFSDALSFARCLTCGGDLRLTGTQERDGRGEIVAGSVECTQGHTWPIEDGVLIFSREDALGDPWSSSFGDYERYLKLKAAAADPVTQRSVDAIVRNVPAALAGPLLDMCTGAGGLLFDLLERINLDVPVVSVDMSPHVLKYDRRYLVEHSRRPAVSFLSCDATAMPLKDGAFSCVTSFGIGNMLNKMRGGVKEAARLLGEDGVFVFSHLYVAENSHGWRRLKAGMAELGINDYRFLGLEPDLIQLMDESGFGSYSIKAFGEAVGDPNGDPDSGPLFPYPNEPVTLILVQAWR